jgi:hypothetical protein
VQSDAIAGHWDFVIAEASRKSLPPMVSRAWGSFKSQGQGNRRGAERAEADAEKNTEKSF